MDVSAFQQKNNYISENIQRITTGIQELKASYEKFVQEQEDSDGAVEQMQQAIQGLGEKSKELEQEIQVLLQEIDESRKKKEEMMESQKDFFEKRDKLMEHMNELNKENFRLESRKNNLRKNWRVRSTTCGMNMNLHIEMPWNMRWMSPFLIQG